MHQNSGVRVWKRAVRDIQTERRDMENLGMPTPDAMPSFPLGGEAYREAATVVSIRAESAPEAIATAVYPEFKFFRGILIAIGLVIPFWIGIALVLYSLIRFWSAH